MGCNTSKESSVQANEAEDNKKSEAEAEISPNDKGGGETNEDSNRKEKGSGEKDRNSASAKTITLRSNGAATSIGESEPDDESKEIDKPGNQIVEKLIEEEEHAATKIQAAFRGHKTRKSMKQPANTMAEEKEPTKEELEAEFRLDDPELCHAATKIQASFRGHMTRKQIDKKDDKQGPSQGEEWDIDLTDPELNKAAVKIQASFRGHMNRKDDGPETK